VFFFFSSRRRHTRSDRDWSSDVCSSDLTSPAGPAASDEEFVRTYGSLARGVVVFGHLHVPFVRPVGEMIVANSGSVGMPYDGDQIGRASCRERGESAGGAGGWKEKKNKR